MDEKRILTAFILTYLLIVGVRMLTPQPPPRPGAAPAAAPGPATTPAPSAGASSTPASPAPATAPSIAPVADVQERRIEVKTPVWAVAFTNRGARLLSWQLLNYPNGRGQPEEMAPRFKGGPQPLDIVTGEAEVDRRLKEGLFVASVESLKVDTKESELTFRLAEGDLQATKTLRYGTGYLLGITVSVQRGGREIPKRVVWGPGLGSPTQAETEVSGYQPPAGVFLASGRFERVPADKIGTARALGPVEWSGVESQYFAALFVPGESHAASSLSSFSPPPAADGKAAPAMAVAELDLGTATDGAHVFVGPKDHQLLAKIDPSLARVVDVGDWIGPFVIPMMALLRRIHAFAGNYGWAIVLLTIGINLAMSPLRHLSIANGVKMSKLAPEMRVIQERYKKIPALDPKRQDMHKEIQALYAKHGMSMSSQMTVGCLPLLITMPFLFAIYRVLQIGIELRGAQFLWIPDLSQKDPLFVIPILMGLSMLVMQKMLPSAMDPAQQRIMMIMPLMFTVMFFAAPAGMNLYWLTSNLCSIVQQAVTMRLVSGQTGPAKAPRGAR